ncbi:MAG: hypothetical protein QG597_4629, partial [Actinomycetota bacterium]|nr:hypothetical protein [Actinomycetota bacterium]
PGNAIRRGISPPKGWTRAFRPAQQNQSSTSSGLFGSIPYASGPEGRRCRGEAIPSIRDGARRHAARGPAFRVNEPRQGTPTNTRPGIPNPRSRPLERSRPNWDLENQPRRSELGELKAALPASVATSRRALDYAGWHAGRHRSAAQSASRRCPQVPVLRRSPGWQPGRYRSPAWR